MINQSEIFHKLRSLCAGQKCRQCVGRLVTSFLVNTLWLHRWSPMAPVYYQIDLKITLQNQVDIY